MTFKVFQYSPIFLRMPKRQMVHPEEFKRQVVSIISQYNFAPTELAKQNLLREGKK